MVGKIEITIKDGKYSMKSENVGVGECLEIFTEVLILNINSVDYDVKDMIAETYVSKLIDGVMPDYMLVKH